MINILLSIKIEKNRVKMKEKNKNLLIQGYIIILIIK